MGQRLLIYDGTTRAGEKLLRSAWAVGAQLYRRMGRVHHTLAAQSWEHALRWLVARANDGPIAEVQYWGHGKWGSVYIAGDVLSLASLTPGHPHRALLETLREGLSRGGEALVWFRTCETFGATEGQAFAEHLATLLDCRVAGHTFVIGVLQSGLHGLGPGQTAYWPANEGLSKGTPSAPIAACASTPLAPNTLHFMNGSIPPEWFRPSTSNPLK